MYRCEKCKQEHIGKYGSGRFCSEKCSRSFSSNKNKEQKNSRISNSLKGRESKNKGLKFNLSYESKISISNSLKEFYINNPESIERIKNSNSNRIVSTETRNKISRGVKGKIGGYTEKAGRGKQGRFNEIYCNSSWELAYLIYCRDHKIEVIRNKEGFIYSFNGFEYKFYPDFIVNKKYVEIKAVLDDKNKAKIEQFPYNIEVIGKSEIKKYLNYSIEMYGKNFLDMYNN